MIFFDPLQMLTTVVNQYSGNLRVFPLVCVFEQFTRGWFTACAALTADGLMGKTPASVSRTTLDR